MAIRHVSFFGGRVRTRPRSLRFKRGDEVRFSLSDGSLAGVTLSFASPSPFGQSSLLLRRGEQVRLPVLQDVAPGRGRIVATPHAELPSLPPAPGDGVPGPFVMDEPIFVPTRFPDDKDPPGTLAGDIDVTPD